MNPGDARDALIESTRAMHDEGLPLMRRLMPADAAVALWAHHPPRDVVNGVAASRYFYHCHPPSDGRRDDEHGHFHLFLGTQAMPTRAPPLIAPPAGTRRRVNAVHVAALSIGREGLPLRWFTVNRWVTDEWLYPAPAVIASLSRFDLAGKGGDPLVNAWLTALVQLSRETIGALLIARDAALAAGALDGEDRAIDVTSSAAIDLAALLDD